jgi:hypothetical protein
MNKFTGTAYLLSPAERARQKKLIEKMARKAKEEDDLAERKVQNLREITNKEIARGII